MGATQVGGIEGIVAAKIVGKGAQVAAKVFKKKREKKEKKENEEKEENDI